MKAEDIKVGHWYWAHDGCGVEKCKVLAVDEHIAVVRRDWIGYHIISKKLHAGLIAEVQRPWWAFWRSK